MNDLIYRALASAESRSLQAIAAVALSALALIHADAADTQKERFMTGIPAGCPFPRSTEITGISLTERFSTYANSDTYYFAYTVNGTCYSPFMDGDGANGGRREPDKQLGFAEITGSDPTKLTIKSPMRTITLSSQYADANARYACTLFCLHDVIYYGSCYRKILNPTNHILRPFAGFTISTDGGASWTPRNGALFPEEAYPDIKMGEPHAVDFGRNLEHSPDGKAYFVGHGHAASNLHPKMFDPHWNWGDAVYLARVTPSIENANDASKYEYFAGTDAANKPVWSHRFSDLKPLLHWDENMGSVAVTWHPGMKKYLMCVTQGKDPNSPYDSYFLESSALTGPWKIVDYWSGFGRQAYFLNFPSKFIQETRSPDGWHLWLCYSANWNLHADPDPGCRYGLCLREIVLHDQ